MEIVLNSTIITNEDYYLTNSFSSNTEFEQFINTIKNRIIYNFGVNVTLNDNILTLSTCTNIGNGRIVVHAKLIK